MGFSWSVSLPPLSINQTLTCRSNINAVGHTCYRSIHNRLALACLLDPSGPPERTPWTEQQLAAIGWVSDRISISDKCVFHSLHSAPTVTIVQALGTHDDKCALKRLRAVCGRLVMIKSRLNPCHVYKQPQAAVGRTDGTQNIHTHVLCKHVDVFSVLEGDQFV